MREHGGAEGEHIDETVVSGGAKRRHLSQRPNICSRESFIYIFSLIIARALARYGLLLLLVVIVFF